MKIWGTLRLRGQTTARQVELAKSFAWAWALAWSWGEGVSPVNLVTCHTVEFLEMVFSITDELRRRAWCLLDDRGRGTAEIVGQRCRFFIGEIHLRHASGRTCLQRVFQKPRESTGPIFAGNMGQRNAPFPPFRGLLITRIVTWGMAGNTTNPVKQFLPHLGIHLRRLFRRRSACLQGA